MNLELGITIFVAMAMVELLKAMISEHFRMKASQEMADAVNTINKAIKEKKNEKN